MNIAIHSKILRSNRFAVFVGVLSVLLIAWADYLTGTEITLVIFYLFPISLATWFLGRDEGLLLSVLGTIGVFVSDSLLRGNVHLDTATPYWNSAARLSVFVILVVLLSRLKVAHQNEKAVSQVKTEMLTLVGHLNLAMTSNLDISNVGESVVKTIEGFFPGSVSVIQLLNRESGAWEPLASGKSDEQNWRGQTAAWQESTDILELKMPRTVRNIKTEPSTWNTEFCRRHGLVSYLGVPLIVPGEALGIIFLYTKEEHAFTSEEIFFFSTLAGQAAIALQNAQLFKDVRLGHAQLRALSRRLLDVQETERRQIATELHDEIGQLLTGLNLSLEMIARLPLTTAQTKLANAQSMVNDLIRRVRGLSLDLRPSMLDDLGLLPTLLWYLERYTSTTGIEVELNHDGIEGKRFEAHVETAAYRIIQEALTNVARHAQVQRTKVRAWCTHDNLIVEIQDEGTGFDMDSAIRAGSSIGLTGMRERAILLGGELNIHSAPGSGTCITAELPSRTQAIALEDHEQNKYSFGR